MKRTNDYYIQYYQNNPNAVKKRKQYLKEYYILHPEAKEKERQRRIKNKEILYEYQKQHRIKNKERYNQKTRERNKNNIKLKEYQKQWRKENKEKLKQYRDKQYKNNVNYKLIMVLRARIGKALKYNLKSKNTRKLLGCSIEELKIYLEKQFRNGMTWENHSQFGWHIDHIIPCENFDLSREEEQCKCFHYTNLQPLWWQDNLSKNKSIQI